jgi:hypothetical protein
MDTQQGDRYANVRPSIKFDFPLPWREVSKTANYHSFYPLPQWKGCLWMDTQVDSHALRP